MDLESFREILFSTLVDIQPVRARARVANRTSIPAEKWTCRESNADLMRARQVFYRWTTGPFSRRQHRVLIQARAGF